MGRFIEKEELPYSEGQPAIGMTAPEQATTRQSKRDIWKRLVVLYADGRTPCNCGDAYYTPCGHGFSNGIERTDIIVCQYGCSANKINAKEEIGVRVTSELATLRADRDALAEALTRTLSWLTSYQGGGAMGAYDNARAALLNHGGKHE